MNKGLLLILSISVIVNIILIQFVVLSPHQTSIGQSTTPEKFPLLSKRIFVENQNDLLINFIPLRNELNDYHSKTKSPVGIYFEYLPSGVSIGINEKENFILASLLKVPQAMAVYKQIDAGKMREEDVLTVKEENLDPFFGNLWKKGVGTKLTVKEAVDLMLKESDNTAKSVLFYALPDGSLEEVFDYLDIPKELDGKSVVVTPKNYSSILRSLYLSSYLSKEHSSEIIETLSNTKFNDKLPAGIPKNIKVAHKIGVHTQVSGKNLVYTDCGIIYEPKRPYILCVMVKPEEEEEEEARKIIKDVSKIVYDYVSNANSSKNSSN
jgi:beta-lactamase class A